MGKATRQTTLPPHISWPNGIITRATWQTEHRTSHRDRRLRLIIAISGTVERLSTASTSTCSPRDGRSVGRRDVPADTVARRGPVHCSSQSIESRSHYRSPNNHVQRSLVGVVRETYEDPRNKYNKGRRQHRRWIDKRSTVATSRNSPGTRPRPRPARALS